MRQVYRYCLYVFIVLCVSCITLAQEVHWMPDANLRQAVREQLKLPVDIPLTQLEMKRLTGLEAYNRQITDLSGLEHATNLTWANLGGNEIHNVNVLSGLVNLRVLYIWGTPLTDITPLAKLTQMEVLHLARNQIADITPLANLVLLETLNLQNNRIVDISPLSNLTRMKELVLSNNQISDVSPLVNLVLLETLHIQNNGIVDISPLQNLSLSEFLFDEACDISSFPVSDRISGKNFPAVFAAWGGIGWSPVLNLSELSDIEHITLHDLYFSVLMFSVELVETNSGIKVVGDLEAAQQEREAFLTLNPNMVFLAELRMQDAFPDKYYDEDYPYWLRNEVGDRVEGFPGTFLLDFTHPGQQDVIVQQALAVAQCGLYDGIFLDWWNEDYPMLSDGYAGNEAEQHARDTIVQRIRAGVGDDFLIIVNTNRRKIPRTGWAINGTFMETLRDYDRGYTHGGLAEIESTLLWAEENLREPRVNCLEGWGIKDEPPDSPANRRWMRVFTTMSLTHSDGYVLYNDGIQHEHYWYDFWDTDLGQPVGGDETKGQAYKGIKGLFIREFTNGWAVYNRSGKEQEVSLPIQTTGVASGITSFQHTVPDLDGEMFLKTDVSADVNGDGVVNIQDLVIVANAFGEAEPDLNGDGVVNIQDLVIVANAF